ncbi:MAG: hypothetical protein ACRERD_07125 [Candidatus Binatia bacterium]
MNINRYTALLCVVTFLLFSQSGCFFSAGAKTVSKTTNASGTGFVKVPERNGQWGIDGPPPKAGDVTTLTVYRTLQKEQAASILYFGKGYVLSDPYPYNRVRIAAIREVGTGEELGANMHYYEVEFDPVTGG